MNAANGSLAVTSTRCSKARSDDLPRQDHPEATLAPVSAVRQCSATSREAAAGALRFTAANPRSVASRDQTKKRGAEEVCFYSFFSPSPFTRFPCTNTVVRSPAQLLDPALTASRPPPLDRLPASLLGPTTLSSPSGLYTPFVQLAVTPFSFDPARHHSRSFPTTALHRNFAFTPRLLAPLRLSFSRLHAHPCSKFSLVEPKAWVLVTSACLEQLPTRVVSPAFYRRARDDQTLCRPASSSFLRRVAP